MTDAMTRRRKPAPWLSVIAGAAGLAIAGYFAASRPAAAPHAHTPAPIPVTLAEAKAQDVPIYLDGLGTVQASNTITIRTQIDGSCKTVNFVEGQQVKKGDVLAGDRSAAAAGRARSGGRQEGAGRGAARLRPEGPRALHRRWRAQLRDPAERSTSSRPRSTSSRPPSRPTRRAIESAQMQLSYTTIRRRSTAASASARSMPATSSMPPIRARSTVLTQIQPGVVVFTLPQKISAVREAMLRGKVVRARLRPGQHAQLATGELLLIDNQIDQTTSTIRLKANSPMPTNGCGRANSSRLCRRSIPRERRDDSAGGGAARPARSVCLGDQDDGTAEQRPIEATPVDTTTRS